MGGLARMAIIIPSKNIYFPIENKKIIDNEINYASIGATIPSETNEIRTKVFSGVKLKETNLKTVNVGYSSIYDYKVRSAGEIVGSSGYSFVAGVSMINAEGTEVEPPSVNKKIKNGIITKVYSGYDLEGNNNVSVDILYDVLEEDIYCDITQTGRVKNPVDNELRGTMGDIVPVSSSSSDSVRISFDILERKNGEAIVSVSNIVQNEDGLSIDASTKVQSVENISSDDVISTLSNGFYFLENKNGDGIWVCGKISFYTLSYSYYTPISVTSSPPPTTFRATGKRKTYTPKEFSINLYGDKVYVDFEEKTAYEKIGNASRPFELTTDEMMQDFSFVHIKGEDGSIYEMNKPNYVCKNVLLDYKNGKETAKILCSVSDYYSVEGEKIISIDGEKMSFDIGDQVIPMVFGADGIDRPMSKYKDGSDKIFRVCGLKFIYDGAVWQELSLQEV
jgi:hypothetical protein